MKKRHRLRFRQLAGFYSIVRLARDAEIPDWAVKGEFNSITRTGDELSIVCPTDSLPRDAQLQSRWVCLKLEGPFALSQTGVLLSFIEPLSENNIAIFTISTYDTDYVLIESDREAHALELLRDAGHG